MHITDKLIESILSNSFEMDCINITLTQNVSENPKIYSGPGTIYKDNSGGLFFKFFPINQGYPSSTTQIPEITKPGQIIPKNFYFNLSAIDQDDNKWFSEYILLSGINDYSFIEPIVIKSNLSKIHCKTPYTIETEKTEFHSLIIIPEKLQLPYDRYERFSSGGFSLNHCIINYGELSIKLQEHENFTSINIASTKPFTDDILKMEIFEILNIIKGKLLPILLFSKQDAEQENITIHSNIEIKLNKSLPQIINHYHPLHFKSFEKLIKLYLQSFETPENVFYKHWLKINRAFQGGFETGALSLTVAIEGIIKKHYISFGDIDNAMKAKIQIAKKSIRQLKIDPQMKSRLLSLTGQIKNPSVKNAIRKLATCGYIDHDYAECWVKLRNQFAHSDEIDNSQSIQQKLIYDYFSCLSVFYILFLIHIKYDGTFSAITSDGWTDKSIKLIE